jgi:hypothetical protein
MDSNLRPKKGKKRKEERRKNDFNFLRNVKLVFRLSKK